jgi:hypothetical protein
MRPAGPSVAADLEDFVQRVIQAEQGATAASTLLRLKRPEQRAAQVVLALWCNQVARTPSSSNCASRQYR